MDQGGNGRAINSFRDLRVWQAAMDLVEQVYRRTQAFPGHEIYDLTNQLRRAAVSVPSNIAEGHARESTKEYLQLVSVAQGSLAELETQLEIAVRLGYCSTDEFNGLLESASSLGRQLYALRNALTRRLSPDSRLPTPDSRC
jgi:four helix bundle protein